MARGTRCVAHTHTAVVAEERHHLQPLSRGGTNNPTNLRWLCANAHSDTHYLLDLIEDHAIPLIGRSAEPLQPYETIPWDIRRTYGPGIRDAALTGWLRYADQFLTGEYLRHRALWTSAGQPRPDWYTRTGVVRGSTVSPTPYALAGDDVEYLLALVKP